MTVTDLLLALGAAALAAWFTAYVIRFVLNDGYGRLTAHHQPPRSHRADLPSSLTWS